MDNPRAEKVAVVDEVRERLGDADRVGRHRVPRPDRGRAGRAAPEPGAPPAATTRSSRTPWSAWRSPGASTSRCDELLDRPHRHRLRARGRQRRGQGAAGLRPGQPEPGGQGRARSTAPRSRPAQLAALADLPPRDVLLARFAGAHRRPAAQLAGLLQALPRNLAYGLSALLDQRGRRPGRGAEPSRRAGGRPAEAADRGPRQPPAEAEAERRTPGAEPLERGGGRRAAAEAEAPRRPRRRPSAEATPSARRVTADGTDRHDEPTDTTTRRKESEHHGRDPDQGPDPRRHRRALGPGAERAPEGVRGALRRDRGRPGGRGRGPGAAGVAARRPAARGGADRVRRRPRPPPATRRSRSSRRSGPSPAWA